MRHLFGQVLKVIRHELKCLTQERIERLCGRSLTNSQRRDDMHGDQGVPANRALLLSRLVEQIVVLHGLGALLQQTSRVVEVHRDCHARKVLPHGVLEDGPDAWP